VTREGTLCLINFGSVRGLRTVPMARRTPYLPEEKLQQTGITGPWTDVYGLSAVAYRMLTGEAPDCTRGDDGSLSASVEPAIRKGLAPGRKDRWQNFDAYLAAL